MSGGHLCPDMLNKHEKGLNMKNKQVVKGITPEQLQGMFLDIAQNFALSDIFPMTGMVPSYLLKAGD